MSDAVRPDGVRMRPGSPLGSRKGPKPGRALRLLRGVRVMFTEPGTWAQRGEARDADDHVVLAESPYARRWSVDGALLLQRSLLGYRYRVVEVACELLMAELGWAERSKRSVVTWNDARERTQQDVVELIDRVLAAYERSGASQT